MKSTTVSDVFGTSSSVNCMLPLSLLYFALLFLCSIVVNSFFNLFSIITFENRFTRRGNVLLVPQAHLQWCMKVPTFVDCEIWYDKNFSSILLITFYTPFTDSPVTLGVEGEALQRCRRRTQIRMLIGPSQGVTNRLSII